MATTALPSLVSLAGPSFPAAPVLSGSLDLPEHGAWMATLELDAATAPTAGQQVKISIASQAPAQAGVQPVEATFAGTVLWSAAWQGRSRAWVVGGAGGLRQKLNARAYLAGPVPETLLNLLRDLAADTGETLTPSILTDGSLAGYDIGLWARVLGRSTAMTGTSALNRLCDVFGLAWRFQPDGTLWVGVPAYPTDPQQPYVADPGDDGLDRAFTVAPDEATIMPAITLLGRQVVRVVYTVDPGAFRARCFYGSSDRDDFDAAVRGTLPELPYLPGYAAAISQVRQNGTLEVICDDPRVGPLDGVVMLAGGPRMTYRMQLGQRVRVLFSAGDPRLYYAVGCEQDPEATQGIARVGDAADGGTLSGTAPPGGGPITFTYVPPAGAPPAPGPTVELTAVISTGSPDQKLAAGT